MDCSFSGTLALLTDTHGIRGRPTVKSEERQFRNGSFRELERCYMHAKSDLNSAQNKYAEIYTEIYTENYAKQTQYNVKDTQPNSSQLKSNSARSNKQASTNIENYAVGGEVQNNMNDILGSVKMFKEIIESRSLGLISLTVSFFIYYETCNSSIISSKTSTGHCFLKSFY